MTYQQISLVQKSMQEMIPMAKEAGELFYRRLFEIAPELRPMFKTDIPQQSRKLMTVLIHIIANLDQLDILEEELKDLGQKHLDYQVESEHYDILEEALLWTFEKKLEKSWNEELKEAWQSAYQKISAAMMV